MKKEKSIHLNKFWLTEQQSLLYQIWLQLWPAPVSRIARTAGIHRVTAYNTLKELIRKGFASTTKKWNTSYYQMVHPSAIYQKLEQTRDEFGVLQPFLESLISENNKNFNVQTFQWFEWICTLYMQLISSTTPLKAFLWVDHMDEEIKQWLYDIYLPKRLAQKNTNQVIVSKTDENLYFADSNNVPLTEVCVIQDKLFDLDCEIVLFDEDKILIATLETNNLSGILIESTALHSSLNNIHSLLWRILKK